MDPKDMLPQFPWIGPPLPRGTGEITLYHGTSDQYLKSILEEGLKTTREEPYTVCLTTSKRTATDYAIEVYSDPGRPIVLTIKIPKGNVERVYGPDEYQLSKPYVDQYGKVLLPEFIKKTELVRVVGPYEVKYEQIR